MSFIFLLIITRNPKAIDDANVTRTPNPTFSNSLSTPSFFFSPLKVIPITPIKHRIIAIISTREILSLLMKKARILITKGDMLNRMVIRDKGSRLREIVIPMNAVVPSNDLITTSGHLPLGRSRHGYFLNKHNIIGKFKIICIPDLKMAQSPTLTPLLAAIFQLAIISSPEPCFCNGKNVNSDYCFQPVILLN
jgi:hypothetical protein